MKGTTTGVWMNGTMTGVVLIGMKATNGCVALLQAHFHWKAQKRVNVNLDTGVTVKHIPSEFDREGVGNGRSYDWIPEVEAKQCQGFDEKCKP